MLDQSFHVNGISKIDCNVVVTIIEKVENLVTATRSIPPSEFLFMKYVKLWK